MELLEERQTKGFERAGLPSGVDQRIFFLDPADRKLLEMTVRGTLTRRGAGMLVGRTCGTVSRRVRRLLERLHDPLVVALVDYGQLLPELYREVGLAYFLRRVPLTRIGVEFGLSRYTARRIIEYIRGWHGAAKRR